MVSVQRFTISIYLCLDTMMGAWTWQVTLVSHGQPWPAMFTAPMGHTHQLMTRMLTVSQHYQLSTIPIPESNNSEGKCHDSKEILGTFVLECEYLVESCHWTNQCERRESWYSRQPVPLSDWIAVWCPSLSPLFIRDSKTSWECVH